MDTLWNDIRYAMRGFRRSPGFALVAVVTLGLGIGANTAIFSFVDELLLKALPYERPDELVMAWQDERARGGPEDEWTSPPNFLDWREHNRSLTDVAAWTDAAYTLVASDTDPERLQAARVASGFFSILGVQPAIGRGFTREDEDAGSGVTVLTHELWQRRFAGRADIVGSSISLDGDPYTVIGVLPPRFEFPMLAGAELYTPLTDIANICGRRCIFLRTVARLRPGVTMEEAQQDMAALGDRLAEEQEANRNITIRLTALRDEIVGPMRLPLLLLLGAVGFLLLIACANVANLLLAQAARREGEIAVRAALGARRSRIARQFLTESVVLAIAGGALGVVIGAWGVDLLVALMPSQGRQLVDVGIDGRVLAFTTAVSIATGIAFGLAPALQLARKEPSSVLRESSRGSRSGRRQRRIRGALVVSEIALALVLMAGAGLLLRSLLFLRAVDVGFDTQNLITATVSLPSSRYEDEARLPFYTTLFERLEAIPGVRAAAGVTAVPLGGQINDGGFLTEAQPDPPAGESPPIALIHTITPNYFQTMRIPVRSGRPFAEADGPNAPPVVIIDDELARRHFAGQDPVGQRIRREEGLLEIVGVVGSVRHQGPARDIRPVIYYPMRQRPRARMQLVLRHAGSTEAVGGALRSELAQMDSQLAAASIGTFDELMQASLAQPRLLSYLLGLFATVALALACFGVYGVMSYSTAQRTNEMGLRMALGAHGSDVTRLVVRQGMTLAAIGLLTGTLAAMALTRLMSGVLYGTRATDPMTYLGVTALLATVAFLACWIPARRATRVDPMIALRHE